MGQLIYCFARDFVRHKSGAESYVHAHCMAAHQSGYAPELFALGPRNEVEDFGFAKIVRTRAPGREFRSEFSELYRPLMTPKLVRRLENEPGEHVIHSFGLWGDVGMAATRELRRRGVKVKHVATCWEVMGPHTRSKSQNQVVAGNPLLNLRQRALLRWVNSRAIPNERRLMRESDAVVVNYRRLVDLIHSEYGDDIAVTELPYSSMTAFDPVADHYELPADVAELAHADAPLIVATSRHAPRKGVDLLIRALAGLRDDGAAFRAALVGRGALLEPHRRLVRELGLADRVSLPGRVPDVRPYLAHADAFALPSLAEGSGSVSILEALQFGVPVVSYAIDGMLEDLTDGEDALLVEPASVPALKDGLGRLLRDRDLAQRLAAAGLQLHDQRFSAEAGRAALAGFYAGLGLAPLRPPVAAA